MESHKARRQERQMPEGRNEGKCHDHPISRICIPAFYHSGILAFLPSGFIAFRPFRLPAFSLSGIFAFPHLAFPPSGFPAFPRAVKRCFGKNAWIIQFFQNLTQEP